MSTSSVIKEACVGSFSQALKAYHKGANRIELCADLSVGGTTPSKGTISQTLKQIPLPLFVLIRPRGGNFIYSDAEFEIMRQDIAVCRELGVAGVVIGALTQERSLDPRIHGLIHEAEGLQLTFHKAFDESLDKHSLIDELISLNFDRILSSGGADDLFDAVDLLNPLIEYTQEKITFVACGGVKDSTLEKAVQLIHTNEFHGKLIVGSLEE